MATFATINNPGTTMEEAPSRKKTYRSFKKKYLKMRHTFRDRMRESNNLFDEQQRLLRLSRRLQEQNDQLLELLLDVNESNQIPPSLRYDLSSGPPSPTDLPDLSPNPESEEYNQHVQQNQAALDEARSELRSGQIDLPAYKEMESVLSRNIAQSISLPVLTRIRHSSLYGEKAVPTHLLPSDIVEEAPVGYLDSVHEEEFITAIDTYLDNEPSISVPLPPRANPSDREKEREYQLQNPMSVYNWLTRHKADIFMDQGEEPQQGQLSSSSTREKQDKVETAGSLSSASGKEHNSGTPTTGNKRASSPKPTAQPTRSTKRERTSTSAAALRHDYLMDEVLDDEGFVISGPGAGTDGGGYGYDGSGGGGGGGGGAGAGGASGRGKRKRAGKDDEAYRPKGGSSRPSKRKRASTTTGGGAASGAGAVGPRAENTATKESETREREDGMDEGE